MKNLLLFSILSFLSVTTVFGQLKLGAGLDTNFDAIGVSGKANFMFNDEYGAQLGFTFFLNESNRYRIDIEGQYVLTTAGDSDEIILKALGGLNYCDCGDAGASSEMGLNLGANISFPISDNIFYIEPRITLISRGDFFVAAGIYF